MINSEFMITAVYVLLFLALGTMVSIVRRNDPRYSYFLPALLAKLVGGLGFGLIYVYYYGYGDTFGYFNQSLTFTNHLQEDFWGGMKLILYLDNDAAKYIYSEYGLRSRLFSGQDTLVVIKLAALINLLTFSKFFATTLWFSFLSFVGLWYGYLKITEIYPGKRLRRLFAISFFFVPGIFFWGSGLMKDTVLIGFFWPLVVALLPLTRLRNPKWTEWIVIVLSFYFVFTTKIFAVFCLIPGLVFMIYHQSKNRIKNRLIRRIVAPVLLFSISIISVFGALRLSTFSAKFNIESAFETAKVYQDYHLEESSSGSSYRLLEFDNPIATYLLNIPGAINVTFFRPYIWEINSAAMALSALESLFVLGLFLLVLRRGGFKTNYRILKSDLVLMGLLIFSLLMAYIVGFSTYNFGTLVRYKIPCLMSLLVILCVLYDRLTEIKLSRRRL